MNVAAEGQTTPERPSAVESFERPKPPKLDKKDVDRWQKRIKAARAVRSKYLKFARQFRDEYYTKQYPHGAGAKGRPLNLIASWVDVVWPQLANAMPDPTVTPDVDGGAEYDESARLQEGYIRKMVRLLDVARQIQYAGFDAWWCIGWMKYGWSAVVSKQEPSESKTGENSAGGHADYDYRIEDDAPFLRYCRDDEILVDPRSTQPGKERWIAHELHLTIEELSQAQDGQGEPLYDAKALESLKAKADNSPRSRGKDTDSDESALSDLGDDPMYQTVEVYEIHCGEEVIVLAKDFDRELRHDFKELQIDGLPFIPLRFKPDGRHYYPPSVFAIWWDLYVMVNEFLSKTTEAAAIAKDILLYDQASVDENEASAIANSANGSLVGVRNLSKYLNAKLGGVPQDYAAVFATCERLADKISRVSDQTRGMKMSGDMTATEVQTIQAAADKAIAGMFGEFTRFVGEVYRVIGQMGFIYQQGEIPVNVGRGGRRNTSLFSREALQGEVHEYNYTVSSSGTDATNPVVQQKRLGEALQLAINPAMAQALAASGTTMDVAELTERYLSALRLDNLDAILKRQEPAAQAPGNQEEQAMRAGIENRLLSTGQWVATQGDDEHEVHLQVHGMIQAEGGEAVMAHMQEHYQMFQVEQQAMMQQMGMMGSGGAGGPQPMQPAAGAPQEMTGQTQEPFREARQ